MFNQLQTEKATKTKNTFLISEKNTTTTTGTIFILISFQSNNHRKLLSLKLISGQKGIFYFYTQTQGSRAGAHVEDDVDDDNADDEDDDDEDYDAYKTKILIVLQMLTMLRHRVEFFFMKIQALWLKLLISSVLIFRFFFSLQFYENMFVLLSKAQQYLQPWLMIITMIWHGH